MRVGSGAQRRPQRPGPGIRRSCSGARSGGTSVLCEAASVGRSDVANRLAALQAVRSRQSSNAPISRNVANRPVRSGLSPTPCIGHNRSRHDQRRNQRKRGGGWVAGHRRRSQPATPAVPSGSHEPAFARLFDRRHPRRNAAASARCDRASPAGSSMRVQPGAFSPASSSADFTCAEATGRRYSMGSASRAPWIASGSLPPSRALEPSAARLQRVRHPAHRTSAQAGVAGHDREQVVARQDAAKQPCRGPGVAHVQHVCRFD